MRLFRLSFFALSLLICISVEAKTNKAAAATTTTNTSNDRGALEVKVVSTQEPVKSTWDDIASRLGLNYVIGFNGPALTGEYSLLQKNIQPSYNNNLAANNAQPCCATNLGGSIFGRYKVSKNWSLNVQTRIRIDFPPNDSALKKSYFRQVFNLSPFRVGFSGTLLSGDYWTLKGAINTDIPYIGVISAMVPKGDSLNISRIFYARTILTPGGFLTLNIKPEGSRWSLFSFILPRFFIYTPAIDPVDEDGNANDMSKVMNSQANLFLQPIVNYDLTKSWSLSLSASINISKQLRDPWTRWRMDPLILSPGATWNLSEALSLFMFVNLYPIEGIRGENSSLGLQFTGNVL